MYTVGTYRGALCDLVHLDGDHSYIGTRTDLINIFDMLHCSTLLLFDDVFDDEESGPTQLWNELKNYGVLALLLNSF